MNDGLPMLVMCGGLAIHGITLVAGRLWQVLFGPSPARAEELAREAVMAWIVTLDDETCEIAAEALHAVCAERDKSPRWRPAP